MNNALLSIDDVEIPDNTIRFRERETELIMIIEALISVAESKEWTTLREKIFDGVVASLKRQREEEVIKQPLNGPKIHNLNGQLKWAEKYLNITDLANIYKLELDNVRKKLNAT